MAPRKARKTWRKKRSNPRKPVARLSKPLRRAVKQIVRGDLETKYTNWYETLNGGDRTTRATGGYAQSGWAVQNQSITNNPLDILRLIPTVLEGTGDFNRIGSRIRPVSFKVKGFMRVRLDLLNSTSTLPTDFTVDLYVLQHRQLKDYNNLYASNNFGDMLELGEGETVAYQGIAIDTGMRVSDKHYTVLQRKRITLRYAGIINGTATASPFSIANSHTYYAEYSLNLIKHLPKVLMYPDDNSNGVPVDPVVYNAPSNSSIFMCMGYPNWKAPLNNGSAGSANNSFMEQTYMTELGFKDA